MIKVSCLYSLLNTSNLTLCSLATLAQRRNAFRHLGFRLFLHALNFLLGDGCYRCRYPRKMGCCRKRKIQPYRTSGTEKHHFLSPFSFCFFLALQSQRLLNLWGYVHFTSAIALPIFSPITYLVRGSSVFKQLTWAFFQKLINNTAKFCSVHTVQTSYATRSRILSMFPEPSRDHTFLPPFSIERI